MRASGRAVHDLFEVLPPPSGTPFRRMRLLVVLAFTIVGVFIVGFGVWSFYAPLESAAIAGGIVEAEFSRKTIQHLEGGIVGSILVKDGDEVTTGQPLIRLDDTRARAIVQILQVQLWEAQALEARLLTERDRADAIDFPRALVSAAKRDPALLEIMTGQGKIFDTRRALQASRIEVIEQRKAQTAREIAALHFLADAAKKRAEIIKKEMSSVATMVKKETPDEAAPAATRTRASRD